MNDAPKNSRSADSASAASEFDRWCDEARRLFPENIFQYLDGESARRCQALIGHGKRFGVWETPQTLLVNRVAKYLRRIDLRKRLVSFLPDEMQPSAKLDVLLNECVLWMTRYALLLRLAPVGMAGAKGRPLDVSTIANCLYSRLPRILAEGIRQRLDSSDPHAEGFVRYLTTRNPALIGRRPECDELRRMGMLLDMDLWSDAPPRVDIRKTTSPKGKAAPPEPQHKSIPYPPIPDDYLAEMGPRVLWLVRDLGPNLLHLFESLPELLGDIQFDPSATNVKKHGNAIEIRLRRYFKKNVWRDSLGDKIMAPPFPFRIGSWRGSHMATDQTKCNNSPWPPRNWENVLVLAASLQAAHLWITLLALAGRISEISCLTRDCVVWARDGKPYINGMTFKLITNLAGIERYWPAPEVLVQALAQQVRLASAWERIARVLKGVQQLPTIHGKHLWASLGPGSKADPEKELVDFSKALQRLAERIGLSPKPGGKALHPHRFRKTIARLAGIAIIDSPRVLMKLLGHKDITMTLHYILNDKPLQVEIDQVMRELRIMRCQELLEDMHAANHTLMAPKYGGHGGGGAPLLAKAVNDREEELHRTGQLWDANSAYELSVILTSNGQYFRTTRPGVLCMKDSRQAGPCNCDSSCVNRIEEKTIRRDISEVIPILIAEGKRALEENQLLLLADKVQQIEEDLARFDDIKAAFGDHPDLVALRQAVA